MKVGVWSYYEQLNYNNSLFSNKNDFLKPFVELYINGIKNDILFTTLDTITDYSEIDAFIFFDFPKTRNKFVKKAFAAKKPMILVIFESEPIKPNNWNIKNHKYFEKIFTWNDDFVDNCRYFKINFGNIIPNSIDKNLNNKIKLCTMIAGNKLNSHKLELYSKRVEAIRWFEKYHMDDFDLYGVGWDKFTSPNRYLRFFVRKLKIGKLFAKTFPSYRGEIKSKKEILSQYKFSICYENIRDTSGYITEKIFDCFFASCVPIYWGTNNIEDHIPKDCFIDKRLFDTYESLYKYIKNMDDFTYLNYLNNIEAFLKSSDSYQFSSKFFSKTLIESVLDIKKYRGVIER